MSAIALAHMGDAVYETLVRTWLCVHGTATGKDLHRATIALVCAPAQYHSATGLECLMGYLYLKGDKNRAEELFRAMMEET